MVLKVDMLVCNFIGSMQSILFLQIMETIDVPPMDLSGGRRNWTVCLQSKNQSLLKTSTAKL